MTGTLPIVHSATPTRQTRRGNGGHGIRDVDLPQRRTGIPLDELAGLLNHFNAGTDRAKDDYYRRAKEKR